MSRPSEPVGWGATRQSLATIHLAFRKRRSVIRRPALVICQTLPGDPGDWTYSPQWWGTQGGGWGYDQGEQVCRLESSEGNGVMTVTAHPAALRVDVQERIYRDFGVSEDDRLEWRVLRFNDCTRQSVCLGVRSGIRRGCQGFWMYEALEDHKYIAMSSSTYQEEQKWIPRLARRTNDQRFTALPFLSFEYLKSMVATALAAFACHSRTRRRQAVRGDELADNPFRDLKILCVGMGGGTLPLFLAHHFPSCVLKVIEIDPKEQVVLMAENYMGFPTQDRGTKDSPSQRTRDLLDRIDVVIGDACEVFAGSSIERPFDIIFIDAFDGDDEIPQDLTTRGRGFLEAIKTETSASTLIVTNSHGGLPPPGIMERITRKFGPGYDVRTEAGKKILDYARNISNAMGGSGQDTSYTISVQSQDNVIIVNQGYESDINEKMLESSGERLEKSTRCVPFGVKQRCARGFFEISKLAPL